VRVTRHDIKIGSLQYLNRGTDSVSSGHFERPSRVVVYCVVAELGRNAAENTV
jgi:hypothetical protein